jgi:hypothetical protein
MLLPAVASAQDELIERLVENEDDNISESSLLELAEQPLDLQSVSREELLRLPFLTRSQIDYFLKTRERRRVWKTADGALEALAVRGDTLDFCRKIFYLPEQERKPIQINSRLRLTYPANRDAQWLGAGFRNYQRVRATAGNFSLAALAERDPGEPRFADLSLLSLTLPIQMKAAHIEAIVGDFFLEWGQGLVLWGPYGQSIGSSAVAPVRRQARGLRTYLSTDEGFALRGGAFSGAHRSLKLIAFLSRSRLDAAPHDSLTVQLSETNGLHRTQNELAKKDNAEEEAHGLGLVFSGTRWRIGGLFYQQNFSPPVQPAAHASNYFDFRGSENRLLSAYGDFNFRECMVAGEWAANGSGGRAFQLTFESESRPVALAAALWSYSADFHSSRGRGFGSLNDPPANQQGEYLGVRFNPLSPWNVEGTFLVRRYPWRTFSVPLPATRRELGVTVEWKKSGWLLRLLFRDRHQDELISSNAYTSRSVVGRENRRRLTLEVRRPIGRALQFLSRLDLQRVQVETQDQAQPSTEASQPGFAGSQEIGWRLRPTLRLYARLSVFDTPPAGAIYVYERDLPGVLTNFALREQGERWYIFLTWHPIPRLQISAKASQIWRMTNEDATIGSDALAWSIQADWQIGASKSPKGRSGRTENEQ